MRGNPIFQWAVFCAFWGLLFIPMLRVTNRPAAVPDVAAAASPTETTTVWITWRFTDLPSSASLRDGGEELWGASDPAKHIIQDRFEMEWPQGDSEIELRVEWQTDGHRAVELRLEPVDFAPVSLIRFTDARVLEERLRLP